jgi:phosphonoacetaldehyde hydrolase
MQSMPELGIRLVVFDWAGTVVDHGSIAPIAALVAAFRELGLDLSEAEARKPMGLNKRDHIAAILSSQAVVDQWFQVFGKKPTLADGDALYERFLPLQTRTALGRTAVIPGVVECTHELRKRGIKMGTTTGYPTAIGAPVADAARRQGFEPDFCVFPDEVSAGRPAPWMIFRNMEHARVDSPAAVLKVGDTVPDIEEGRSAACWCVGIGETGSEVGMDLDEWRALPDAEKAQRAEGARKTLLSAGAHAVIPSLAHLPPIIDELNQRLGRGERP